MIVLRKDITFDFGSISADSVGDDTGTFDGAVTTDAVVATPIQSIFGQIVVAKAWVITPNTVSVHLYNPTAAPVAVNTVDFRILIIRA